MALDKSSKIAKDATHYLSHKDMLGGEQEVQTKLSNYIKLACKLDIERTEEEMLNITEKYRQQVNTHKFIIYDFECDVHTNTHLPNHITFKKLSTTNSIKSVTNGLKCVFSSMFGRGSVCPCMP